MGRGSRMIRTWPGGWRRRGEEQDFERPLRSRSIETAGATRLPLAHVTNVHAGRRIVEDAKLKTRDCAGFGEPLVYFFVLRPAYFGRFGGEKSDFLDYFPIALILRPEAVATPRHLYPFDTGGAAVGAFGSRANRLVPLEDYELETSHEAATGFVQWAFGDLGGYYDGTLRRNLKEDILPAESVANGYLAVAKLGAPGDPQHDTRASTLEMASADNVDLAGNVLLAILPKQLIELPGRFMDALGRLTEAGTAVRLYDWRPNRAPAEFQRDILRIAREWYALNGFDV